MCKSIFNSDKMYTYIRGFATGAKMSETLKALSFAREKHDGQFRKSGDPYIVHPLTMACNALSLGIRDDEVIATILLHDVCEDCSISLMAHEVSTGTVFEKTQIKQWEKVCLLLITNRR